MKKLILMIMGIPDRLYNYLILKYKNVSYETYPKILGRIFISGPGILKIGKEVKINSNLSSNPIGGDTRTIISISKNATVEIKDHTGLSNVAISCKKLVIIGNHVKIGGGVKIYDSDFHSLDSESRKSSTTDVPKIKEVELRDGCFIGAHSIILKGVTIGENSIIGAGSVVSKSIPSREIWGGNPARFIKKIEDNFLPKVKDRLKF